MSDFEWDPDTYLPEMRAELPGYEELQEAAAAATDDLSLRTALELGIGTGETTSRRRLDRDRRERADARPGARALPRRRPAPRPARGSAAGGALRPRRLGAGRTPPRRGRKARPLQASRTGDGCLRARRR